MKRAAPVLLAILLGALATGIGMGIFLKLANDDRAKLAQQITQAQSDAAQALKEKQQIADEANKKVSAANDEVSKAQHILQSLAEEQRLLTSAKQLLKPGGRDVKGWQTAVSLPLGVSILLPPKTIVEENDAKALTAIKQTAVSSTVSGETRWLSVTPYQEQLETELIGSLTTSTPRSYLVNGRLLTGAVGQLDGVSTPIAIFRVRQTASSTHLIWIKDPGTLGTGDGIERLLGTLEFAN